MADSDFLLPRKSILIVIGSFEAGLTHQLYRILRFESRMFRPVPTYTTCEESELDTIWFRRVTARQILEEADMMTLFTFYQIGQARYYVKRSDIHTVIERGFIALIGMTNEGYERFLSIEERSSGDRDSDFERALHDKGAVREYHKGIGAVKHVAVSVGPKDVSQFAQALVKDLDMPYERALECARRAVATSSMPPKSSGAYRLHLPLEGPKDEKALGRLAEFLKARSS